MNIPKYVVRNTYIILGSTLNHAILASSLSKRLFVDTSNLIRQKEKTEIRSCPSYVWSENTILFDYRLEVASKLDFFHFIFCESEPLYRIITNISCETCDTLALVEQSQISQNEFGQRVFICIVKCASISTPAVTMSKFIYLL